MSSIVFLYLIAFWLSVGAVLLALILDNNRDV